MTTIGGLFIFMLGFVLGGITVILSCLTYASKDNEIPNNINKERNKKECLLTEESQNFTKLV